jgi:hypothetical protein
MGATRDENRHLILFDFLSRKTFIQRDAPKNGAIVPCSGEADQLYYISIDKLLIGTLVSHTQTNAKKGIHHADATCSPATGQTRSA